jgi:hypothetical protein
VYWQMPLVKQKSPALQHGTYLDVVSMGFEQRRREHYGVDEFVEPHGFQFSVVILLLILT